MTRIGMDLVPGYHSQVHDKDTSK